MRSIAVLGGTLPRLPKIIKTVVRFRCTKLNYCQEHTLLESRAFLFLFLAGGGDTLYYDHFNLIRIGEA